MIDKLLELATIITNASPEALIALVSMCACISICWVVWTLRGRK